MYFFWGGQNFKISWIFWFFNQMFFGHNFMFNFTLDRIFGNNSVLFWFEQRYTDWILYRSPLILYQEIYSSKINSNLSDYKVKIGKIWWFSLKRATLNMFIVYLFQANVSWRHAPILNLTGDIVRLFL